MRVQRMVLGNFRGTAGATCDSEVLRELGASSLAVELCKARLMYVPHLVCVEQSLLAAVLLSSLEDPWANALEADLEDTKASNLCRSSPGLWKELVRLVYKRGRREWHG